MNDRKLYEKLNQLYGMPSPTENGLNSFKNELYARISMFFINNPDHKVDISASEYRRLHDGGIHTWAPWDWIGDVMVEKKMSRYIEWVD